MATKQKQLVRFPRHDFEHVLENIPRLDLSKVKDSHPLIDNFVMEGCTQVGYGKFGTRKTSIHLLAGFAVSRGIPFLGKKTQQRMVLYLDYENPSGVLKQYCKDLRVNPDDPRFTIWDRTKEYPPLPGDEKLDRFIRRCKKATGHSPWIIFDSWTSLLRAGDSGDKIGDATHIFRAIRKYCDQGATITIIDHTGKKEGDGPIGTSAKMTQMDTAHKFSVQDNEISTDGRSARSVIRVENFLKRFAPKDIGTFSIEITAAMDEKDEWHTVSVEPTKDKAVIQQEQEIAGMKHLIRHNPTAGQEELARLAADGEVCARDRARRLLQEGIGKHWKAITNGKSHKQIFHLLKTAK
jgi:RecA-family ATPase